MYFYQKCLKYGNCNMLIKFLQMNQISIEYPKNPLLRIVTNQQF